QRERVDQHARAPAPIAGAQAVAAARYDEEEPDVAERNRDDEPTLQHAAIPLCGAPGPSREPRAPRRDYVRAFSRKGDTGFPIRKCDYYRIWRAFRSPQTPLGRQSKREALWRNRTTYGYR